MAPCRTWDNATIFGEVELAYQGHRFPITFHTKRIAPGESNTWSIRVLGMKRSMAFSSKYELADGREKMRQPFYCATPQEAHQSHLILTQALASHDYDDAKASQNP
jgi:hypothetical protein